MLYLDLCLVYNIDIVFLKVSIKILKCDFLSVCPSRYPDLAGANKDYGNCHL